ncbi:MAG: hypothetical protein K2K82_01850 [Muribaculaceae bacterium]|nr:hypothetical protein [Muribaculaceae bacterium]
MRFKWILPLLVLCSCDEGRIWPDEYSDSSTGGLTASVEITDSEGANRWFGGYSLAVAGFMAGSEYALISKNIEPDSRGAASVELTGIPAEVETVELCVIDRLRRRVATFASVDMSSPRVTLVSEGGDFSPENAIQTEVFNTTCINCHGGAAFSAAGLNLTSGHSFGELIGVSSINNPEMKRVLPGQPEQSLLYRILAGEDSKEWNYDHSVEITASERLDLIKNWIIAQ